MHFTVSAGLLALAGSACATVFESVESVPAGWKYVRDADAQDPVRLRISLQQQNVESFEQLIMDVSTPDHPSYGKHLEKDEVRAMLKPTEAASDAVISWLEEYNVTRIHDEGDWVHFVTNAKTANSMLDTTFAWYEELEHGEQRLRTLDYSVPDTISPHINFVQPTIKFGSLRAKLSGIHAVKEALSAAQLSPLLSGLSTVAPPSAVCNEVITPQCLLSLYNVHYGADAKNGNKLAFASFLDEYARYTDLTEFETTIAQYALGKNFSVVEFNGGMNDQTSTNDSTEANLDCQYQIGVGYPVPVTEYSTGGCGPLIPDQDEPAGACDNEPYLDFLHGILALPNSQLPQTLSVSYGDDEQTIPLSFAKQVCSMFGELGARGVSVLFASGDSGPGNTCENNSGTVKKYVPAFPASCPYVTAVGATMNIPEQAASFSGGGFSNYFTRPAYQQAAVAKYLQGLGNKFSQYYNHTGRGYPDVSAQGVDFLVVNTGVTEPVDGTSAAAPTFASVVGLLNAARITSGQKPLGFLNPFLYSTGFKGLNDITTGGSTGCASTIPFASWNATVGWDPVTGLGTPDFGKLLKLTSPSQCNVGGPLPNPTMTKC